MVEKSLKTSKREAGDNFSRGSCHLAMQNDLGKNKFQYNYYYRVQRMLKIGRLMLQSTAQLGFSWKNEARL